MASQRVDRLLVARGLAASRTKAQALIDAGKVRLGDHVVRRASELVDDSAALSVTGLDHPFVSRGGVKLEAALEAFALDVRGFVVADFGASTGGFCDCLLRRGAARVYAIDVGHGQLHETLRRDPRVVVMEGCNARELSSASLPEPVDLVVIDASFISATKLLEAACAVLKPGASIVTLVKPQFEVGPEHVGKRGVVRDDALREQAVSLVAEAARALGLELRGRVDSPIEGPKGNRELLVWLARR